MRRPGSVDSGVTVRASGGSRTHNPRITNAVLCQLKLRWQIVDWSSLQVAQPHGSRPRKKDHETFPLAEMSEWTILPKSRPPSSPLAASLAFAYSLTAQDVRRNHTAPVPACKSSRPARTALYLSPSGMLFAKGNTARTPSSESDARLRPWVVGMSLESTGPTFQEVAFLKRMASRKDLAVHALAQNHRWSPFRLKNELHDRDFTPS